MLAPWESRAILTSPEGSEVTVNSGLGRATVTMNGEAVRLRLGGTEYEVERAALERHSRRRSYLAVTREGSYEVEVRSSSYYKLTPVEGSDAPTLEIDGIHMHRVSGVTPLEDARLKVRALGVRPGSRVLEIGTGLGYTALAALRSGASLVVSVELDENVLWIAERNPWSWHLASDKVIVLVGDAVEVLPQLEGPFDYIIHDPPRLTSRTGALYGATIYRELFRLLRPGGAIFHYTGEPGRARGRAFWAGVASRLRGVGFEGIRYVRDALGVVARKPRQP